MYYLLLHLADEMPEELRVHDKAGRYVRAEFLIRSDAELARVLVERFVGKGQCEIVAVETPR